ncbi:MAG: helix-hairpin-helix domain-containing protein [Bacteroidia bacterium]|nr:helix-hairpin-helix domain-containing protein [Bacteroidia bacterium]
MKSQKPYRVSFESFAPSAVNVLIVLLAITPAIVYGQSEKLSEIIITVAEELAADDSDPEAAASYIDRLYELAENPIKLNSSREDEISKLFFLSDFQVKALADYAHSSGRVISVYELVNIPGFDKETVEMIIPFITLDNKVNMNSYPVRWRNTSITNLSIKPGNNDTSSLGSPWKMLTKYKFTAGGFSGGFTVEKDP